MSRTLFDLNERVYNTIMIKGEKDKMIRGEEKNIETKKAIVTLKDYSFPAYGITVKAGSLKEAEEKLLIIIKKKDNE